jgi:hypothetical protein
MSMVAAKSLVEKLVTSAGTVCRLPTKGRFNSALSCLSRCSVSLWVAWAARSWSISCWSFWFCWRTEP